MNIHSFRSRLNGLDALLRAEGMPCGADVWQSVFLLLERLEQQRKLPDDARQLAPLLGPLFCRHPEDQARFPVLFMQWLEEGPVSESINRVAAPGQPAIAVVRTKVKRVGRYWIAAMLVMTVMLLALTVFSPKEQPTKPLPSSPTEIDITAKKSTISPAITIVDRVAPRLTPVPPSKSLGNILQDIELALTWLPWLLALLYLIKRYHQRWILNSQAASGDDLFNHFSFERVLKPVFGGAEAERALRDLRAAHYYPTRRLDIANTVDATARAGGYFQPVYRSRRASPEHLLLVRSLHRKDLQAALAEELVKRFRKLGIQVQTYRFRDDPRWLVRWNDHDSEYSELDQLVARHADARLLVISDTSILFHPLSGEVRPWLQDFTPWQDRVWLHPRDAGADQAALLAVNHFSMFALAQDSLPEVVAQLTAPDNNKLTPQRAQVLPLPDLISAEPDAWLGEKPPFAVDLSPLLHQLEHYLGSYGLRLLRAVAVYPKPHWQLMQALDYLLFKNLKSADSLERREQRLTRLSRLPWMRHAHCPDWLREHLLQGMDKVERQRITTAWRQLFKQLTNKQGPGCLELEVRTPSKRQIKFRLADLRAMKKSEDLNDAIFANILLGGKLGLLDFALPQAMARLLPKTGKWFDLRPALTAVVFVLIAVPGFNQAWETYAKQALTAVHKNWIAQQNAAWRIDLHYQADTQRLANRLQKSLLADSFQTTQQQQQKNKTSPVRNTILYAAGGQAVAQRVAHQLAWMTYGAEVQINQSNTLTGRNISVQLSQTYQRQAGFNDELLQPYNKFKPVAEANLKQLPVEPDMVVIKPGTFLMGSNEKEQGSFSFERPQHQVNIDYSYEIGKYEVTFAEYDLFAVATGRAKPNDEGWGRENRPVINISFTDAQAYIRWLALQTGKNYRLPTEAEWEYAARAGSQTAYWWGDNIGKNNAVCAECGSEWDSNTTAPVGSFKVNPFGLYDTAGNVYEWTLDCWHQNYNKAPEDGSAWLEAEGGECGRRVVRGGSWNFNPLNLRSAFRNWGDSDVAGGSLGFRIARAL